MFKLMAVTDRKNCVHDFCRQIKSIAASGVSAIILREKDMTEPEYEALSKQVIRVCEEYPIKVILHTHCEVAKKLGCRSLHLPLPLLEAKPDTAAAFDSLGVSVHTLEQAEKAAALGATYLIAGHIFMTDCKKGLEPRGTDFLETIVKVSGLPVYGIGGITPENIKEIKKTGAAGACVMSAMMKSNNPKALAQLFLMNQ